MLSFASDYMEAVHPEILKRISETNLEKFPGYGTDEFCDAAREKIRKACACPEAEVHFLVGGTQTNATVIDALLHSYQGVVAADSGHISVHEAGAIEFGGHKVLTIPHQLGKIGAEAIRALAAGYYGDGNRDHIVMPGMVYLSQPTEYGTLYSLTELEAIRAVCDEYDMKLYVDGARLAYGLACPENDVTLADLARLCDLFYIGGTKCGALFGEALVISRKDLIPHFFTIMKQHGALLAKGWLLGMQFDVLFEDGLYLQVGENAIRTAQQIKDALHEKGYRLFFDTPTNQIFVVLENTQMAELEKQVSFSFWEAYDETHTTIRFATSWATTQEDVAALLALL